MPRQVSAEKQREYDELKRFFEAWQTQLFPNQSFAADHPHHPVNALASIEQRFGHSKAYSGLKQAVNDCLEGTVALSPGEIARIDAVLQQAGAPAFTQVLARQSKTFKAILRRGQIRSDTEFYLVSAALADSSIVRTEAELSTLGSMVASYKARPNNSFRPNPLRGSA